MTTKTQNEKERMARAAPALLAALEKWLRHAEMNRGTFKDRWGEDVPLVKQTRAAIAKARSDQ